VTDQPASAALYMLAAALFLAGVARSIVGVPSLNAAHNLPLELLIPYGDRALYRATRLGWDLMNISIPQLHPVSICADLQHSTAESLRARNWLFSPREQRPPPYRYSTRARIPDRFHRPPLQK